MSEVIPTRNWTFAASGFRPTLRQAAAADLVYNRRGSQRTHRYPEDGSKLGCGGLSQTCGGCSLHGMSTVQEIEAAIPQLSPAELEQLRAWFEDYLEDQLELTDELKAKLDESRREIAAGHYTTRQPG